MPYIWVLASMRVESFYTYAVILLEIAYFGLLIVLKHHVLLIINFKMSNVTCLKVFYFEQSLRQFLIKALFEILCV